MNRAQTILLALSTSALCAAPIAAAPTADYQGHPFVTQPAPTLKFERRLAPRPLGIDYPFAEQTARGVALFSRFPAFSMSDRRIHVSGPWYNDPAANLHFSRGITSIEPMPNYRQGPSDAMQVPSKNKWMLMTDPLFWGYAARLADRLAAANPQDERIAPLRTFANDHKFSPGQAAFMELGRDVWRGERGATDAKQQGVLYPCLDIELTGGWEHQRNSFGWIYQGMAEEAARDGVKIIPQTYGQWTFEVGAVHNSMRQGGTGDPEYLAPEKDFLSGPDPTLDIVNQTGGAIAMDGYMQAIWGNEPFYARKPDGSIQTDEKGPVFNPLTQTTAYGQTVPLEAGEAEHCLSDLYRQAIRMYLMHHRFAGQYPARSDLRKLFLNNTAISAWTRITNEGLQGIQANDRPLPPWLIENLTLMYLFTADDYVVWSSDVNTPPRPLGADNTADWKYNAHGVMENLVKAAHRYSALDPLHLKQPFSWCWFRLPMVNKNQTDGERPDQKPLAFAKLRTFEGKPWIEMLASFPALDNQSGEMKLWVDKDGKRSPAYTIRLANGRSSFYDAWQLPEAFKNLEGKDIWLRFKDATGTTRTWRGDWREKVDETVATPADYRGAALMR